MKPNPRVEMKRLAIVLVIITVILLAATGFMAHSFFRFGDISWDRIFRTESIHHHFMIAFGAFSFLLLPCMALICGYSSWIIFKHLDKVSDEIEAA